MKFFSEVPMNTFNKFVTIRKLLVNRAAEVMMYDKWDVKFAVNEITYFPIFVKEQMKNGGLLFETNEEWRITIRS